MTDDERIGATIEAARKRIGMTQTELAMRMQRMGTRWTQVTVCHIEKGRRSVRLTEAAQVASAVGVSVSFLAAGSPAILSTAPIAPLPVAARTTEQTRAPSTDPEMMSTYWRSAHQRLMSEMANPELAATA